MATEFKLPELGEDVDEGVIVSVLVSEGDTIEEDQNVVEIETDKATLEVPCSLQGKVSKVHVSEGDTVKVGDPLISVGESDSKTAEEQDSTKDDDEESSDSEPDAKVAQDDERAASNGEKKDNKNAKDTAESRASSESEVAEDQEDEPASDKKKRPSKKETDRDAEDTEPGAEDQEAEASDEDDTQDDEGDEGAESQKPDKGKKKRRESEKTTDGSEGKSEDEASEKDGGKQASDEATDQSKTDETSASSKAKQVPAPPSTRRLARELGVDIVAVAEQHPGERLSSEHVKAYVRDRMQGKPSEPMPQDGGSRGTPALPDFEKWGPIDRVPLSALERRTSERLSAAWVAPHVTHYDVADIGRLESLRQHYAETAGESDPKLTLTAFLIKAAVQALRKFPKFNASLDSKSNELILKHYYHIGVAVHTDRGLLVPVLRDCDEKSVIDIAGEVQELAERTRNRKVSVSELRGSSFTITNVGGIGGTSFAPILSWPEVAILGAARAQPQAVVTADTVEKRLMLPLCLSFDHRPINGVDAARFVREVVQFLENPDVSLMRG